MARITSTRGTYNNVITYEHICDTTADMINIKNEYKTHGSICIVISGSAGSIEIYTADSNRDWISIGTINGDPTTEELKKLINAIVENSSDTVDIVHTAGEYAEASEAWAVGTRNGEPIGETDLAYENNAKKYALDSEAWATGYRGGTKITDNEDPAFENNAKKYAMDAGGSATAAMLLTKDAEAWAIGKKNGVAVGSSEPQYQNNAKYWSDHAFSATPQGYEDLVDGVDDLKSAIIKDFAESETALTLSQGGITTTTGNANQSDKRVRTAMIVSQLGFRLYLPTDVHANVYYYDADNSNAYLGYEPYAGETVSPNGGKVRIVYYVGDGTADITPSDVSGVKFYNFLSVSDAVPPIVNDILTPYDETLKEQKNIKSLFKSPYKIQTNVGIGNAVDPTPSSESACACICYPCLKGDRFTLTGAGYSSIRLWAFTDTSYKLLSIKSGQGTETNAVYTAEQDGYFIANVNPNKTYALSVYTFKDFGALGRFDSLFPKSRFYKPVSWAGSDLGKYIHVNHGDFDLFTRATTAAQYYQLWNTLAEASGGYITATELGLSSDNATTMYAYDLKPIAGYVGPKLFIVCGQHGFEKAGPFGLYYFVRELVENYRENPTLMYLRNWCEFVIIPLMNPYGFNNNVYTNANGVNLNRNWPTSEWHAGTSGTTNYGGSFAGSEVETQYAVSLFTTHNDALVFTDIHTNGQTAVSNYSSVMWQAFETEINEDEYSKLCVEAAKKEINDLSSAFCIDYPEDCPTYTQIGHYSLDTATGGLATIYAREHNMLAETVEGFPAWPNGTTYKPSCHQANADIYANWLRCVLAVYERLGGNKYIVS